MNRIILTLSALVLLVTGLAQPAQAAEVPAISAASAVLLDAGSGRILYAKDARTPRAMASTTKLMTALVVREHLTDLSAPVTIRPEWTGIEGTSLYLKAGETYAAETLLYGLLLHSGNDAAVALAGHCAGDLPTFVDWMNAKARELGMEDTHFTDPSGLGGEDHYASARDMALLGRACLEDPVVRKIVATKSVTREGRTFVNHNKLLWLYPDCTGMKTGFTKQAGRTLVSSAQRGEQALVCVTLGAPDDWADHRALLDYGFDTCPSQTLVKAGEVVGRVPVTGSLLHTLPVEAAETVRYPLREGETVTLELDLPGDIQAPVYQGATAGRMTFCLEGSPVAQTTLIWSHAAPQDVLPTQKSLLERLLGR